MSPAHFSVLEKVILFGLTLIALGSFTYEVLRRVFIIQKGLGSFPFDRLGERLFRVFREVLLHEKVIRERPFPGLMHAFVFWGFLVFGLVTIDHFAIGFYKPIMSESVHHAYSRIVIPFAVFVIIGILSLAYRRFINRPIALGQISPTSGLVAVFIVILMVTYIYGETDLSPLVWKINWWIHSILILAFLFLIPRSKHLHLVLAPFNIFFRSFDQPDHTPVHIDLEGDEDELDNMLNDLTKLTKNQTLDIFSCVECGRCTDVCPANRGGGILDPKYHFIMDLRDPVIGIPKIH